MTGPAVIQPPLYVTVDGETVAHRPHYFSTACQHDEHETCRKVCKFCPEKCRCDCHKGEGEP